MTHNYSSETIRDAARRVLIEKPDFGKLGKDDAPDDVNGRTLDLEILCQLPGRDAALCRQLRHWIALNMPGLIERLPSPDNTLRRFREVRDEMEAKGQLQPTI